MVPGVYLLKSCAALLNEVSILAAIINPLFIISFSCIGEGKYSYSFVNPAFVSLNFFQAMGSASTISLEVIPISPFCWAAMSPARPCT